jgi:proprotein convertase subtilisin/kexin type 5
VSCSSSKNVCNLCQPTHRLFTFNSSSVLCLDAAPEFYYDNGTDFLPCVSPCLHCTAKFKCIDCIPQYYLDITVTNYCYKCNDFCQSCNGPTAFDCISCIDSYFLDNGLCRKLSCSAYQYVNSLTGCTNCSTSYPHSLTCTSLNILSC